MSKQDAPRIEVRMTHEWVKGDGPDEWTASGPWNGWAVYYNEELVADVGKSQFHEVMTFASELAKSGEEPELSELDSGGYWVVDGAELEEWYEEFMEARSNA